VRRRDCIERSFAEQITEPGVAQAAGGFFDGFGGGFGCSGDVDAGFVEGDSEIGGQGADEGEIGVGFLAAEAMMEMGYVQDEAEFGAALVKGAEEGY